MEPSELKDRRKELGLTQLQLADLLNTPYDTYVKWERGLVRMPGVLKIALEKVFSDLKK